MIHFRLHVAEAVMISLLATPAAASELSYRFVEFQYIGADIDASGRQFPVTNQIVEITTSQGDGVAVGGSFDFADRFFLAGFFQSTIADVAGLIINPLAQTEVTNTFDFISSRISFGYQRELSPSFDIVVDASLDSAEYDFGAFAGEDFDVADSGAGFRAGFRWNPRPALEFFGFADYSTIGSVNLDQLLFESDTSFQVGAIWYFFEDVGLGIDYRGGQVSTFTISMRFSFGTLPL